MIEITYPPVFIRKFKKLEIALQQEVVQKINLFKSVESHSNLKVHKLHGKFKNQYSFSVNYKYRIAFRYISANEVLVLDIDGHDMYK